MAEWQMRRAAKHEEEKAALDALLSSGLFNRAPSLGRLLEYICQKYFEGETDQIKEYNIAVEALNRPPHFDQKKDSIVRVEAHRLRKRLQQYYAGQGADLTIHITIPEGRYVPRFLHRLEDARQEMEADAAGEERSSDDASLLPVPSASPAVISDTSRTARSRSFMWRAFPYSTAAVTLFAIALVWWAISRPGLEDPARAASRIEAASRPNVPLVGQTVRIAAGRSGQYVDRFNNVWSGDDFFVGGEAITPPTKYPIRAYDSGIFTSRREGVFKYEIPLPPGSYELRLYFAEMMFGEGNSAGGGETSRVFNVFANGVPLLKEFDVIADAGGPRIGDIRAFRDLSPDKDGKLRLEFWPSRNNLPFVNAIEVVPGNRGHANPIRTVMDIERRALSC